MDSKEFFGGLCGYCVKDGVYTYSGPEIVCKDHKPRLVHSGNGTKTSDKKLASLKLI